MMDEQLLLLQQKDYRALARTISLVENKVEGYGQLLINLPPSAAPVIGITGPPGAGKSTLTDALIGQIVAAKKTVGVLCVDPSSPFNFGALLGDRVRMSEWYTHPSVFIRSLATRGSLGGLHPMIIEIADVMKAAGFNYIIVETVGVGQSEVEIAGLADVTVVVVVPEAGDDIQTMKAGLMEIADLFVVNKADRPDADTFVKNLRLMYAPAFANHANEVEILQTIASKKLGIDKLFSSINAVAQRVKSSDRKYFLLAEKAYQIIQQHRMKDVSKQQLYDQLKNAEVQNIYSFLQEYNKD
jgi:LAO/AO transport system kinase